MNRGTNAENPKKYRFACLVPEKILSNKSAKKSTRRSKVVKELFGNSSAPDDCLVFIHSVNGKQQQVCEDIPDPDDFNHPKIISRITCGIQVLIKTDPVVIKCFQLMTQTVWCCVDFPDSNRQKSLYLRRNGKIVQINCNCQPCN